MPTKLMLAALPEGNLFASLVLWSKVNGYALRRVPSDAPDLIAIPFDLAVVDTRYYRERYFEYMDYVSHLAGDLIWNKAPLKGDDKVAQDALWSEFLASFRVIAIDPEWKGDYVTLVAPTPEYLMKVVEIVSEKTSD